jgi:[calcium/calmodulin-dependent protein kinase] kinase
MFSCTNQANSAKLHGPAIDIWALGVTLYFFIFGRCPFIGDNEMQMFENIRTKDIEYPREINTDLANLLQALLQKEPEQRPTIQMIKSHPWTTAAGEKKEIAQPT